MSNYTVTTNGVTCYDGPDLDVAYACFARNRAENASKPGTVVIFAIDGEAKETYSVRLCRQR